MHKHSFCWWCTKLKDLDQTPMQGHPCCQFCLCLELQLTLMWCVCSSSSLLMATGEPSAKRTFQTLPNPPLPSMFSSVKLLVATSRLLQTEGLELSPGKISCWYGETVPVGMSVLPLVLTKIFVWNYKCERSSGSPAIRNFGQKLTEMTRLKFRAKV